MKKAKTINTIVKIKDFIIFILISILFFLPLLKHFLPIYLFILKNDYTILKIIGIIGLYFFIIYIAILFYKTPNKKILFKKLLPIFILLLYMFWTLISSIFSEDKYLAFIGTFYRHDGYITYLLYAGCFGLSFGISSHKLKKSLLYVFTLTAIFSIILIKFHNYSFLKRLICRTSLSTSGFFNSNHHGYYLLLVTSISCFLFITEKNIFLKTLNLIMYSFLLYYFILNNTFGCYIALIATLIIFMITAIIKKEHRFLVLCLISIIILIITSFFSKANKYYTTSNVQAISKDIHTLSTSSSDYSKWKNVGNGRMKLWYYGSLFIIENPILGYGPENLENKYLNVGINQDRPHNLLIQLATTSGIPGLLLYLSAIGSILLKSFKTIDMKKQLHTVLLFSVISYLFSSMFGNSMYYTSPYFFILLGFLFKEITNLKDS